MVNMKIITAHQPAYLPWLGLIHKIAISDVYVFLDNVQFQKNSFINRNKIKTTSGPIWLTVPVKTKDHLNKTMEKLEINNTENWRKKHWMSIMYNYKKAPYFDEIRPFLEEIYEKEWIYLKDITETMLKWLLEKLKIRMEFVKGSELNLVKKKSDLILELTKKLDGNCFAFGKLGGDYADRVAFKRDGISIYIQNYNHPTYPQLHGDFESFLTVFDLIANVGLTRAKEYIMKDNITKEYLKNKLTKRKL